MKKIRNILTGWYFWLTNQHNELAQERLAICAPCIHRKGYACGLCWCPLQQKARVEDEKCDAGKWKK